jgi:hypothetical protein
LAFLLNYPAKVTISPFIATSFSNLLYLGFFPSVIAVMGVEAGPPNFSIKASTIS